MNKDRFIVNDDMFGAYVKVPTGASRDMHIYKVIGRIESNVYCDVPIMAGKRADLHSEIVPVLNVVHCGVSEDTVIRVSLSDCEIVQTPNAPLTLEELREMEGGPVFIKSPGHLGHWALVQEASDGNIYFTASNGTGLSARVALRYGGKVYRRKPEEGMKHG